jgi:hypothetical protein
VTDPDEEMLAAFAEIQRDFEAKMFEELRTSGTAILDQYEAHVRNLVGLLRAHRPQCAIFNRHHSEMCPGLALTDFVEQMGDREARYTLVMAVIMLARRE